MITAMSAIITGLTQKESQVVGQHLLCPSQYITNRLIIKSLIKYPLVVKRLFAPMLFSK